MDSRRYNAVTYDADQSMRAANLQGSPWTFINLLPIALKIYVYTPIKIDILGEIPAQGKIVTKRTFSGMELQSGYEIHVLYAPSGKQGPEYEIMRPVFLFDDSRMIRIGDVMHEAKTNTLTQRTHTDIMGLRIHNRMTLPLDIYYRGTKIGHVAGDDGTDAPMSGSPGSVYLTNDSSGFRIGDKLEFVFPYTSSTGSGKSSGAKRLYQITIHDNYMSDLYIGVINQHYVPTIQDMFSYQTDRPTITGLRYFDQITGYQSMKA